MIIERHLVYCNFEHAIFNFYILMSSLSVNHRVSLLKKLSSEEYDLLVIGGGITGAGIALDAASRGIKTALVEKQDFAAGTSSRSTKLIHGGLRYLKQLEIGLVREVGRERAIVHDNAPHLVVPEKMLLALIESGTYVKLATSFGLWIYDLLAGVKQEDRRKMLSKKQTSETEPLLRKDILRGGGLYVEYRTDDARLTLEIIKTASKYGADVINYYEAKNFKYEKNKIAGLGCEDLLSHNIFTVRAKQIVNATGPWVDMLRKNDGSLKGKRLHLTKGVHLVVPREKFPIKQSVYFDVPDGRMMFAIPRGNITYFGTTDTDYTGSLEHPVVTRKDADYLLHAVNFMFPGIKLSVGDIISSWAGLRPLIHEEGRSPSELSRKDEIFISESGLISIAGGKLTGYRKMAERVVDLVIKNLHQSPSFAKAECKTGNITISGGEFQKPELVKDYIQQVFQKIRSWNLGEDRAEYLVRTYGRQTDFIIEKFKEFKDTDAEIALARAELWFAVNNESVFHLQDFFVRRTGRLYFEVQTILKLLPALLPDIKNYLGWNEHQAEAEKKALEKAVDEATDFR